MTQVQIGTAVYDAALISQEPVAIATGRSESFTLTLGTWPVVYSRGEPLRFEVVLAKDAEDDQ